MKNFFKIIFINIIIFFSLIGMIVFIPIVAYESYHLYKNIKKQEDSNSAFLKEFKKLKFLYSDYTTYKLDEFKGAFINIDNNGNRKTVLSKNLDKKAPLFFFFGPSTIWGLGLKDEKTIPSVFSLRNNVNVENFSTPGYTSRQSLAKLINFYIQNPLSNKKRIIIFNDGGIDIYFNCDKKNILTNTQQTQRLEDLFNDNILSSNFIIKPVSIFVKKIWDRIFYDELKDSKLCTQENIEAISKLMINNWLMARKIVESHGDIFISVLTPISFENSLNISSDLKIPKYKQIAIEKAYEFLRKKISSDSEINFIDLSNILYKNPDAYIDSMHYSDIGSEIYVKELTKEINKLKLLEE
ncbi:hypothetical protein OZZ08_10765 [Malaciobacter mytili]|uniref:hypothetical protein n=1 Tax=Malaciobacter mytili TaxID=603050 RepID=UPI003BAEE8DC